MSEDGSEVYLADFGVATKEWTVAEFVCGTPYYMSPGMSTLRRSHADFDD